MIGFKPTVCFQLLMVTECPVSTGHKATSNSNTNNDVHTFLERLPRRDVYSRQAVWGEYAQRCRKGAFVWGNVETKYYYLSLLPCSGLPPFIERL